MNSLKVPERYEKSLRLSSSVKENPYIHFLTGETANVGGDRMNPGIKILLVPSATDLLKSG